MLRIVLRALVITALCSLFSGAAWYFGGVTAFLLSLPIFAVGLSRVIIDLLAELRHGARKLALEHLDGKYFSYLGVSLQVLEDEEHCRWIPISEVRRIVGSAASDRALELTYPGGWRRMGKPEQGYLRDDALMTYLAKEPSMKAIKFKNWAQRNIAFPAGRQRQRLGIHLTDASVRDSG